jgi:hypothetical protein
MPAIASELKLESPSKLASPEAHEQRERLADGTTI